MKRKTLKIAVVGDFAEGMCVYSGQTAKVRDYYYYLCKHYGEEHVVAIDTRNWKRNFLAVAIKLTKACFQCNNFVLLLCTNGIRTVLPFVMVMRHIFKYKVFFPVVGGSLMDEFEEDRYLKKHFGEIDAVYFETKMLLDIFSKKGYKNVFYAPVFSKRKTLREEELPNHYNEPYPLCTYSRVCKEKGISDAIDAVVQINKRAGRQMCTLDVYGEPVEDYKEEFENKVKNSNDSVFHKPLLTDFDAIDTLSNHYCMVFPTYYEGEGFPIALIECMKAGLPVVATNWHFNSEIIDNGFTGLIYEKSEKDGLINCIEKLINNQEMVFAMKKNCIQKSHYFHPESILQHLFDQIDK